MAALILGSKTLRTLISSPTLSLSHIEETSAALSDALDDANEINQAISDVNTLSSEQEDEIDNEFAALLAESERTKEKEQQITRAEPINRQREQLKEKEEFNVLANRIESLNIRPAVAAKDLTKDSEPEPAVREDDSNKKVPIME
jgi:biopolymer transport protein ExbB/TolQ